MGCSYCTVPCTVTSCLKSFPRGSFLRGGCVTINLRAFCKFCSSVLCEPWKTQRWACGRALPKNFLFSSENKPLHANSSATQSSLVAGLCLFIACIIQPLTGIQFALRISGQALHLLKHGKVQVSWEHLFWVCIFSPNTCEGLFCYSSVVTEVVGLVPWDGSCAPSLPGTPSDLWDKTSCEGNIFCPMFALNPRT